MWAKKLDTLKLYQQSNIPYIFTKEGMFLCFNNFYSSNPEKAKEQYSIEFYCHSNILSNITNEVFQINLFPIMIPTKNLIKVSGYLDKTEITLEQDKQEDIKNIAIVNAKIINNSKKLEEIIDELQYNDKVFVLSKKEQVVNDFIDISNFNFIYHENWYTSLIQISDSLIDNKNQSWVYDMPKLEINCYGFKNPKTIEEINEIFDQFEIEVQTICN